MAEPLLLFLRFQLLEPLAGFFEVFFIDDLLFRQVIEFGIQLFPCLGLVGCMGDIGAASGHRNPKSGG